MQAAHDRADRHTERIGRFLVRQLVEVDEFDDSAKLFGQRCQRKFYRRRELLVI